MTQGSQFALGGSTRSVRILLTFLSLLSMVVAQDTVNGPLLITLDTTEDFKGSGTLTTADTDNPVNGVAGPILKIQGTNWMFQIRHVSPGYFQPDGTTPGGFSQVQLDIQGEHQVAPHQGEFGKNLPLFETKPTNIPFGQAVSLSVLGAQKHPGAVGVVPHHDFYSIRSEVTALPGEPNATPTPGPPNLLTGPTEILAAHRRIGQSLPKGLALGSTARARSRISYDMARRELSFKIGRIDVLDAQGGLTGRVNSAYATDPVLAATWTVSNLKLLGREPDGRFRFGGGTVTLTDRRGNFTFEGSLDEFFIGNTTKRIPLTNFGLFNTLFIANKKGAGSRFLQDFSDKNMMARGIPKTEWMLFQGIDFALVTSVDLSQLTNGFSSSASNLPATYFISANGGSQR